MSNDGVQATLTGDVETKLVNVTRYGRSGVRMIGRSSKYGNPFKMEKDGGEYTRESCVEAFREWWYADEQADLREQAREELRGETLGCYCLGEGDRYDGDEPITAVDGEPAVCHGEVILEYLNGENE
ncbi:DUF4326 domain-containing protein [Halopiger xanaduensis]|uniref:DUF4326 domain-containing protein n=1 Tax=Halopiger xanaduensis (strain DSM 18323 / JCM 14033 / SH-6) TaxID=797210 RepID=F8DER9_HALXS|nr:DUF4326 domain-containing protein [Halopiger xanaduensis]AEH39509.1 hypothetical protein Halxa_0269 [Halopiger xanaduensis SH-6]